MTVHALIERLKVVAEKHGWECQVLVLDGEGEWPFSIHVEREKLGQARRIIVCLDVTDDPDRFDPELPTDAPNVTDFPPSFCSTEGAIVEPEQS